MTSTEHTTAPTVVEAAEQDGQAGYGPAQPVAEVEPLETADAEGIGGPLLVMAVGGMGLVLVVLAPVAGAKIGGLVITVVAAVIVFRLLARRGGGSR
jgi:hypothetical protein